MSFRVFIASAVWFSVVNSNLLLTMAAYVILKINRFLELFGMVFAGHLLYAAAISPYREDPLLMFIKAPYQVNAIILVSNWSGAVVQARTISRS